MNDSFYLLPPQASSYAHLHDYLFYFLTAMTLFFIVTIGLGVWTFAIYYRRREGAGPTQVVHASGKMEAAWIVIPTVILIGVFAWGLILFMRATTPPKDALEISVVGKQWMWKVEHTDGRREINELHVPVGKAVHLTMISQDVIHDFGLPAFRVKQDVLPGHYSSLWFEPTLAGSYHIFCDQYCGTNHYAMIGRVVVMPASEYEQWQANTLGQSSPAAEGRKLFEGLGCIACHGPDATQPAPKLEGVYGKPVKLSTGSTVTANEDYIRESILDPQAKIVAGFGPIMPSFRGRVSEDEILELIAYIKSVGNAK